jgi:hypothetical protein
MNHSDKTRFNALNFPSATGTGLFCLVALSFVISTRLGIFIVDSWYGRTAPMSLRSIATLVAPTLAALSTALLIYAEEWNARRSMLSGEVHLEANVVDRVRSIASQLNITIPIVLFVPTATGPGVEGLGRPWRLILDSRSLVAFRRIPERFDAIVAHELSHIASRDALRRAAITALMRVMYALIALGLVIPAVLFFTRVAIEDINPVAQDFWPLIRMNIGIEIKVIANHGVLLFGLMIFVPLAYTHVMRRQERIADWVTVVSGFEIAVRNTLSVQPLRRLIFFRRAFALHPPTHHRLATLGDNPLASFPFFELFLLGLLLYLIMSFLPEYASMLQIPLSDSEYGNIDAASMPRIFADTADSLGSFGWISIAVSSMLSILIAGFLFATLMPFAANQGIRANSHGERAFQIVSNIALVALAFTLSEETIIFLTFKDPIGLLGWFASRSFILESMKAGFLNLAIAGPIVATVSIMSRHIIQRPSRSLYLRMGIIGIGSALIGLAVVQCILFGLNYAFLWSNAVGLDTTEDRMFAFMFSVIEVAIVIFFVRLVVRICLGRRNRSFDQWRDDKRIAW